MRQAKFHTIVFGEQVPEIGSQFEKSDCLIAVQLNESGSEVELLFTDGNGKVVRNNPRIQTFNSVEEANAAIRKADRYEGKRVYIYNTYSIQKPILTETGKYDLDDEGNVQYETVEFKNIETYAYMGGVEDENLIVQSPSLENVVKTNARFQPGVKLTFPGVELTDEIKKYFNPVNPNHINFWSGLNGTNIIINNRDSNIDNSLVYYSNTVLGGGNKLKRGQGNVLSGVGSAYSTEEGSFITALGGNALADFIGGFKSHTYENFSGDYWGGLTPNIAIGNNAGKGLKQGWGNVYIGSCADNRPEVEDAKLVIHSYKRYGLGSTKPNNAYYPLIFGDFVERWFEISGKIRLNNKQNAVITDFNQMDEMAVFSSKDAKYTTQEIIDKPDGTKGTKKKTETKAPHFKEMNVVNAKDYLIYQIENMNEEQKQRLKTALGI